MLRKQLGWLALAAILGIGALSSAVEAQKTGRPSGEAENPEIVVGQLVKIEGEFYVIRTADGDEFRLRVTERTKMDGTFRPGDRIEVEVTRQGRVEAIRPASKESR